MNLALAPLPSRRDEDWRYADIKALAKLWPLPAPERIVVAAGEHMTRTIVQDAGAVVQITLVLQAGASARFDVLNIGGAYGRIELHVTLHENADFELGAVQIAGTDQTQEIVTVFNHVEPGATSRQVVRSVLAGKAVGTYLGRVEVARDAQKTDSEQDIKAMVLDRSATANARPELEIYADDVKCAHGCAVGELDAMGLFYLQSRGLTPADAKTLMLQAFVAGVFDGSDDQDTLQSRALAALEALA